MYNLEFNDNQKEAINFHKGCCNVIASAGSGKTGVLVHRIKNLVENYNVDPQRILAITFSKKAKENMVERLEKLLPGVYNNLHIDTFHSFGYSIIRKFNRITYKILDADWKKNKIIEDIYKDMFKVREVDGCTIAELVSYISYKKNLLEFPNKNSSDINEQIYYQYEKFKKENYNIDFDDMLTMCYEILSSNEKALVHCQNQFEFILADEMQDTNKAQYEIIRLIAEKNKNVFFVDDPLQCIYQWRGSDNKYVLDFDSEWENPKTINLNCNYRSSRDIVTLANKFATTIPESQHKNYVESISNKDNIESPHYKIYVDEKDEANQIAKVIEELVVVNDCKYSDIAILARTNAQLVNFESAMHKKSIPYYIVDGAAFVERKEIKLILSYLKLSSDLNDEESFNYIYNRPNRFLGKQFLNDVKKEAIRQNISMYFAMHTPVAKNFKYSFGVREIADVINTLRNKKDWSVKDKIAYLRNRLNIDAYVSGEVSDDNNSLDKIDNLNTLENIAEDYISTEEFVDYMSKLVVKNKETDNAVKLMTIHKSKGLEFPVVFIVGVNEGLLPHHRNENIDEERRLMYVAITRAEEKLYISSTYQYGRSSSNPSVFIDELFS